MLKTAVTPNGPKTAAKQRTPRGRTRSYKPYKRSSDGRWFLAVTLPDGNRRTVSAKTDAAVRAKLPDLLRDIAHGKERVAPRRPPAEIRTGEVLARWLVAIAPPVVEKNTWDGYQLQARHLGPLHNIPADKLTRDQVRTLRTQHAKTHAARTVNAMLQALRIAFNWAADETPPLTTNTDGTRAELMKTQRSPVVPLHPDDVSRILRQPPSLRKDEAVVLLGTGLRTGELLGIRNGDWEEGWLTVSQQIRRVPKSGRGEHGATREVANLKTVAGRRRIAPAPFAAEVLDRLAAAAPRRDTLLFPTRSGGPQHGRTLNRNFHGVQTRAGCEQNLGPHSARHTVAAQLIAGGANLDDVKRYLGHDSIEHTSDLYGHWIEGRARELGVSLGLRLMPEWAPLTDRITDGIAEAFAHGIEEQTP